MSTRIKTQIGEKTCDGCGKIVEVNLIVQPGTPEFEELGEILSQWYKVGRRVSVGEGQFADTQVEACCLACVPVAAVKLAMPPTVSEPLDLASLQVNRNEVN